MDAASHEFPEDLEAGNDAEKTEKENRKRGAKWRDEKCIRTNFVRPASTARSAKTDPKI